MILFYSTSCQHCSVLLDTIQRHDTKKTIKLVCVDSKISIIKSKITNVPALMFLPTKEVIYGKAVFDYLLLPNRGYLFNNNSTREKGNSDNNPSSINSPIPMNNNQKSDELMPFTLGRISNDNYSDINDNNINSTNIDNNRNYVWELIDTNKNNQTPINNLSEEYKTKSENKLPTLEELTKERENLFKDIK